VVNFTTPTEGLITPLRLEYVVRNVKLKNKKFVVRITGKKAGPKSGKKRPTMYLHLPYEFADAMGVGIGDYVVMEFDGEKLVVRKLSI